MLAHNFIDNNFGTDEQKTSEKTIKPVETKQEITMRKTRIKIGKDKIVSFDTEILEELDEVDEVVEEVEDSKKRKSQNSDQGQGASKKFKIPKNQPSGKCHFQISYLICSSKLGISTNILLGFVYLLWKSRFSTILEIDMHQTGG